MFKIPSQYQRLAKGPYRLARTGLQVATGQIMETKMTAKYAIYLEDGVLRWGLPPTEGHIKPYEIIETYINYPRCSSEFHIYNKIIKKMNAIVAKATRQKYPAETIEILRALIPAPTAPLYQTAVDCLVVMQEVDIGYQISKLAAKGGTPRPGSIMAMTEEEKEAARKQARAAGFTPRF